MPLRISVQQHLSIRSSQEWVYMVQNERIMKGIQQTKREREREKEREWMCTLSGFNPHPDVCYSTQLPNQISSTW